MPKRIKLHMSVPTHVLFTHQCAACMTFLLENDYYCPTCGERLEEEEENQ